MSTLSLSPTSKTIPPKDIKLTISIGFTWRPNPCPESQAFDAMRAALAAGANFWNGGEFYGTPGHNSLTLLKSYFAKYPGDADKVVLSIKGGIGPDMKPDGSAAGVRRSVEICVKLLGGAKKIDVFECARVDPNTPVETTMAALKELVAEGLIGGICLSEVGERTIRRAASVAPIAGVEVEVSMFEDNVFRNGVAAACAELDIPVVAYSPLGRGFLTGQIRSRSDLPEDSMLRHYPRYSEENFDKNLQLVRKVEEAAKRKGCTTAQFALAWVWAQSGKKGMPTFVPIPGATTVERVHENMKVVELTPEELAEVDGVLKSFTVAGTRYPEALMGLTDG